jgi:hypothetical protein
MRSPNFAIRKKYKALIEANVTVVDTFGTRAINVFYQYAPQNAYKEYVIMTLPNHNELGTINETKSSKILVQLKICTKEKESNSGQNADQIADKILQLIYPNKINQIDLLTDNFQCYSTRLVSDNISNYQTDGNMVYIDRIITFEHIIYHK